MTRTDQWYEFTVNVTLKVNNGTFGIKYDRHGDFTFCAQSAADARAIAGHSVAGEVFSIDTMRIIEIVGSQRIDGPYPSHSDECKGGAHDDCHFRWCKCPHHSAVQFAIEHAQIPLHQPIAVDDDEDREAA